MARNFELIYKLKTYYPNGDILDNGTETKDADNIDWEITQFERVWENGERWELYVMGDNGYFVLVDHSKNS